MSEEVQRENKIPIVHICRAPWGIGGYTYIDENGKKQSGYGYYKPQNPNDFYPDYECCTKENGTRDAIQKKKNLPRQQSEGWPQSFTLL